MAIYDPMRDARMAAGSSGSVSLLSLVICVAIVLLALKEPGNNFNIMLACFGIIFLKDQASLRALVLSLEKVSPFSQNPEAWQSPKDWGITAAYAFMFIEVVAVVLINLLH